MAGLPADDGHQAKATGLMMICMRGGYGLGANPTLNSSLPTLEEMLAARARDPDKFSEIERRVSQYCRLYWTRPSRDKRNCIDAETL